MTNENVVLNDSNSEEAVNTNGKGELRKPECAEVAFRLIKGHALGGTPPEDCFDAAQEWLRETGCAISEQELEVLIERVYAEARKAISKRKRREEIIKEKYGIIYSASKYYQYVAGCYREIRHEQVIRYMLETFRKIDATEAKEAEYFLKGIAYVDPNRVNATSLLNLKNGLFDIGTYTLRPHSPEVVSTIQLDVEYREDAQCEKWLRTIDQILGREKALALQEFFGLCLTKETKYEKALVCLGEGANGKSVVLGVLGALLGAENYSAIPIERFDKSYYIAKLFGKLANISIEVSAKGEVCDSMFKSIISGDAVDADAKYGHPFTFRPFCKLVFATNNMPRVDDKTDAFYRRLIVLEFNKQFKEEEQNKNLKTELLVELNGIFLWALEGLKRLRQRDRFEISESMKEAVNQYRRENNSLIIFLEEGCVLDPGVQVSKRDLYIAYNAWCKEGNYKPLAKNKFGKELKRQVRGIDEIRASREDRECRWIGVRVREEFHLQPHLTGGVPF